MGLGDVVNEFRGLSHAAHHAANQAAQVNRDAYKARQYASSAAHNYGDHKEWHKAKEDINANADTIRGEAYSKIMDAAMTTEKWQSLSDAEQKIISRDAWEKAGKVSAAYRKQGMSEANKDFSYKKLTGHNRNNIKEDGATGYIRGDYYYDATNDKYTQVTPNSIKDAAKKFGEKANTGNIDAFANQADYLKILPKRPNWPEAGL